MKKTLIALSVSAVAMATCVNAAEIYNQDGTSFEIGGRAEGRLALQDGDVTDKSRVRINVLGKQMINDELYGLGFWEGEFTSADDESIDTRYLYAGLGGKFGEVSYGKTQGSLMVLTDFTDIMSFHGNSAAYKLAVADRTDNMLAYKGQFDNLALRASYRFDSPVKESKDSNADVDTDGYSLSAIYAVADTGLELGAGYADQYDVSEYMLAASYTVDNLYFAGLLTDSDDYTGYELAAAYTMGQTVFSSTYNNAETNDETSANNLAIDATYYFKPNFRGYVSYNFNMLDEDDITTTTAEDKVKTEDEVALGLRYDF